MADKCAPHPWARAQSRPSSGERTKSILLLFSLCTLFAPRVTPDTHTETTRITSVIYINQKDPIVTDVNNKYLHHRVTTNTQTWDSYPCASPEGPGTTPSVGLCRWINTRPPGAAMRLTALRQPEESPKPMTRNLKNSRPNTTLKPPIPSNHTFKIKKTHVLPTPGKTERGDYRGG